MVVVFFKHACSHVQPRPLSRAYSTPAVCFILLPTTVSHVLGPPDYL